MGIPEGVAMKPPTVLFIAHWRLLIFDEIVKSQEYPLSLEGRGSG
jgi:hypothetical protein